jgi:hypothetical protein
MIVWRRAVTGCGGGKGRPAWAKAWAAGMPPLIRAAIACAIRQDWTTAVRRISWLRTNARISASGGAAAGSVRSTPTRA